MFDTRHAELPVSPPDPLEDWQIEARDLRRERHLNRVGKIMSQQWRADLAALDRGEKTSNRRTED